MSTNQPDPTARLVMRREVDPTADADTEGHLSGAVNPGSEPTEDDVDGHVWLGGPRR
jgi:hypothetical protein